MLKHCDLYVSLVREHDRRRLMLVYEAEDIVADYPGKEDPRVPRRY